MSPRPLITPLTEYVRLKDCMIFAMGTDQRGPVPHRREGHPSCSYARVREQQQARREACRDGGHRRQAVAFDYPRERGQADRRLRQEPQGTVVRFLGRPGTVAFFCVVLQERLCGLHRFSRLFEGKDVGGCIIFSGCTRAERPYVNLFAEQEAMLICLEE